MFPPRLPILLAAAVFLESTHVQADIKLPAMFSDHAVLQKSDRTAVWGRADPGEEITATFAGASAEATADGDGKWRLTLDLSHVGAGPFELTVAGHNTLVVHDVVVGEVWLASGQSNMEFPLARAIGGREETAVSADGMLRQFRAVSRAESTPQEECVGKWVVAGPATSGDFTAVGYFFAKELRRSLGVPVGLLAAYWGGTPVESWTSAEALDSVPDLKEGHLRIDQEAAAYDGGKAAYVTAYHDWEARYDRTDRPADPTAFAAPGVPTVDWKPVTLPGKFSDASLPDTGAVWLRKVVPLHDAAVGAVYSLNLTGVEGFESVYYNGRRVAALTPETVNGLGAAKTYYFAGSVEGDNVIAVRVFNPVGGAGLVGDPGRLALGLTPLKGEWLARVEREFPALPAEAKAAYPQPPKTVPAVSNRPCTLYNGMIHPLVPYTLRGAIWYQGENNTGRAFQYRTAFPLMITDWRARWGSEFPFYFCQLASHIPKNAQPSEYGWAELREAQTRTLSLRKTGQAVLIDIGEAEDVHPRDKKTVGLRLAALALARDYGKAVACSGPVYTSHQVEDGKIRVRFDSGGGGLVARPLPAEYVVSSLAGKTLPLVPNRPGSQLEGFAICGEDHKWVWADAAIDGDTVVVSHPAVTQPVAVRYAWAGTPTINLYNEAGFPAGPFRTDTFPGVTDKARF